MKSVFYVEDDFVARLLKQYFVGNGNHTFFVKRSANGNPGSQIEANAVDLFLAQSDDPDRQVMVIDYADVEKNPRLIIRSIRDELVELVRGVYLGKILFNSGDNYSKIGYFALRTPR